MTKPPISMLTRLLALLAAACSLAACEGSGSGDGTSATPQTASRTVSGVVSKGPISGARISIYAADSDGFRSGAVPLAQTTTDAAGNWSVALDSTDGLLVMSAGGSYVDESDDQPDPGNRRTVEIADDSGFEAYLPPGLNATPLNVYTMALLRRSRLQNTGGEFDARFLANRNALTAALGFDPVLVMPSDPIAPAASDSIASRRYAMALGGAANSINSLAIALGAEAPDFHVVQAVVDDLTDCRVDAQAIDGVVMVQTAGGELAAPAGQDLNAQILRFRNNNFAAYASTPLLTINANACGTVVVTPDTQAPSIAVASATPEINALSAEGTPSTDASLLAIFAGVVATDDRPGPVSLVNDAPAILPLGDTTITFTASDLAGNIATASVVVTVADLEPPQIVAPADLSVVATGALTSVQAGAPVVSDNVTAAAALLVVSDAPPQGFGAGDTLITWTVTDGAGLSASDTQTISVLPAPPTLTAPLADVTATEGVAFAIDVSLAFSDPDSALQYSISGLPAGTGIGLNPATGLLAGTPLPIDVAASPLQLQITASDGNASVSDGFSLSIVNINVPPSFSLSPDLALEEDFTGTAVVLVTPDPVPVDELAQVVSYTLSPAPQTVTIAAVSFDAQTGTVSVTSLPDANGSQQFTVTADDGQANSNLFAASFTLSISAVNDPPSFVTSGDVVALEDFAGTITVTMTPDPVASDEAAQTVVYSLAGPPVEFAVVTIDPQSGSVFIQSLPNATGNADVTVVADDGQAQNATFERSFSLNIESANDVPQLVAGIDTQTAVVGSSFSLSIADNFTDVDGDTLVFDMVDAPASFSLNPQTGVLSGVAAELDALIRRFDITVTAIDTSGAETDTVFDLFVEIPDRDRDGLSDDDELAIGTDPDNPDTDNDGVGDRIETETNSDPLTPTANVFYVSPDGDDAASGLSWAEAKASNAGLPAIPAGASADAPTYVLYANNLETASASADWRLSLTPPCDNIHLIGSQDTTEFATKLTPAGGPATRFAAAGGTVLNLGACSNVVVSNIEFTGATTGAVAITGADVAFQRVVIRDNLSAAAGAGLRIDGGSVVLRDSTIASNGASADGGGIHASGGASLSVFGSRFEGNLALGSGGAVYVENADDASGISNSQFTGNRAARGGAVALANIAGSVLANNTMRNNQADEDAAAIWFDGAGTGPVIRDSVLIDNVAAGVPSVFNAAVLPAMSSYNLIDRPVGGVGSIDASVNDPQLTAAGFLNQALSPAIDAGSMTAEAAGLDRFFTDPDRFAPLADTGPVDLGVHSVRPYSGGADDYDEPLAVQDVVNLRPGLGPQPVIIQPTRNGQSIGAGHRLVATTDDPGIALLLSVTTTDPLGNSNSVLLVDLGNGDYRFAADAGPEPGETELTIFVDGEPVNREPPVVLRQCSPPVICEF